MDISSCSTSTQLNLKRLRRTLSRRSSSIQNQSSSIQRQSSNASNLCTASEVGRISLTPDDEFEEINFYADLIGDFFDDLILLYDISLDISCSAFIHQVVVRIEKEIVQNESYQKLTNINTQVKNQKFIFESMLSVYKHLYENHYIYFKKLNLHHSLDMCHQRIKTFLSTSNMI